MMMHHGNDKSFKFLASTVAANPHLKPFVKNAQLDLQELSKLAFADQDNKCFPIDTPDNAVASYIYIQANERVGQQASPHVKLSVERAVRLHGLIPENLKIYETKTASSPEPFYLLPDKQRWAVEHKDHVKLAEDALKHRTHELGVAERVYAAKRLVKRAAELNEPVSLTIKQAAAEVVCDKRDTQEWLDTRAYLAPEFTGGFRKISELLDLPDGGPFIYDTDVLLKVASVIEKIDRAAGLEKHYGKSIPDPVLTVFNTDKVAEPMMDLGGKQVAVSKVLALPPDTLTDIFGDDLISEATDDDGNIVDADLISLIETMPRDLKLVLARYAA